MIQQLKVRAWHSRKPAGPRHRSDGSVLGADWLAEFMLLKGKVKCKGEKWRLSTNPVGENPTKSNIIIYCPGLRLDTEPLLWHWLGKLTKSIFLPLELGGPSPGHQQTGFLMNSESSCWHLWFSTCLPSSLFPVLLPSRNFKRTLFGSNPTPTSCMEVR